MSTVKKGIYKHYKGGEYEVTGFAKDSETGKKLVIYKALYGSGDIWARPYDMFCENVECDGNIVKRFAPEN